MSAIAHLPVTEAISQRFVAVNYLYNHPNILVNSTYLTRVAMIVMGLLTLLGKISPSVGITSLAVTVGVNFLLGQVVTQIHTACTASKLKEMNEIVAHPHPHLKDRWQYFSEQITRGHGATPDQDQLREVERQVDAAKLRESKVNGICRNVTLWLGVGVVAAISVITAMALNNYWSVTQLKVVAGSALLSCGLAGLLGTYAWAKIIRNKDHEFFLAHYKEGSPLIAEAEESERAAAAASQTRLLTRV